MSLTRDDWMIMWEYIKEIDKLINEDYPLTNAKKEIINYDLDEIRAMIQSVIGQIE